MRPTRNSVKFSQPLAWLDLVFNIMMSFAFLFVLSYILIAVVKKDADLKKPKAEMLIVMTWPDYAVEDIDLWLKLPNGSFVAFPNKESPLINLERDDRGLLSDWVLNPITRVSQISPINKEIITFRGLPPGKYEVSAHYYSSMSGTEVEPSIPKPTPPYPIKVEITKLNPTVVQIFTRSVTISHVGQEVPVVSFVITTDGVVEDFTTEGLEQFVPLHVGMGNGEIPVPAPAPIPAYPY